MALSSDLVPLDDRTGDGRRRKASERVAAALVDYIVENELPEGARLPTEKDLAETLGVGRATLREGLRLLESRGALTIKAGHRGGPVVRRPRASDLGHAISLLLQFEGASLMEVLIARKTLEPVLAELAAPNLSQDDLDALTNTVEAMRANPTEDVFHEQNQRFHDLIMNRSHNSLLSLFLGSLAWLADGTQVGVSYSERQVRAIADAHERIVEAFRDRDGLRAAQAMRDHLDEADAYWHRHFDSVVTGAVRWSDR